MSATLFDMQQSPATRHQKTKIPVPMSPTPLRRSNSMRLHREERAPPRIPELNPGKVRFAAHSGCSSELNRHEPDGLRRGKSFMERGERGNGVNRGATNYHRPYEVTTNSKDYGGGGGLRTSPTGPSDERSRSLSLSLTNSNRLLIPQSPSVASSPRTPPTSPSDPRYRARGADWDTDSVTSGISGVSLASSTCDHASVARNGTTFSGRSMKYVFHCNQHAGATGEDYLTPTQRAHKQVRKLKILLQLAQKDLERKDSDILKLTKEVVELRLYKAALSSPEERSNSSDAVTVKENDVDLAEGIVSNHIANEMTSSYTDSGHYDDYTNSSIHSKDSVTDEFMQSPYKRNKQPELTDKTVCTDFSPRCENFEHHQFILDYEKRIQDLVKSHESESQEQRQKHNDKVEELLQRIAEINKRYWELVPDLDNARERIKELESQLEDALRKLEERDDKHKQTYLQMYVQGQEAAKHEREKQVMEIAQKVPSRISVPELLQQLQVTQTELENIKAMYKQVLEAKNKKVDPEITLQFLKSAIYYFLTDKENNQGHLRAIQSILGFTPSEISCIERARNA